MELLTGLTCKRPGPRQLSCFLHPQSERMPAWQTQQRPDWRITVKYHVILLSPTIYQKLAKCHTVDGSLWFPYLGSLTFITRPSAVIRVLAALVFFSVSLQRDTATNYRAQRQNRTGGHLGEMEMATFFRSKQWGEQPGSAELRPVVLELLVDFFSCLKMFISSTPSSVGS